MLVGICFTVYLKRKGMRNEFDLEEIMERSNPLYKIRRKLQVLAYHVLPHDVLSKLYYHILIRDTLNLSNPQTLNEKLQWLKLYYFPNSNLAIQCADKYQVRKYIKEKGVEDKLTSLFGVWEKAEDIDWDLLPQKFVLKCTHGCAYNIICNDKENFNKSLAIKQLNKWLKENFAAFNVELHYGKIKHRRIIAEEFLGDKLIDYKFFCFNGQPRFLYISSDLINDRQAQIGFFDIDGNKIPLIRSDYEDIGDIVMPECFSEMIEVSKKLSEDFPFVRVDFFKTKNSYVFAELTFTPSAAMMPLNPKKYDVEWGKLLDLSDFLGTKQN